MPTYLILILCVLGLLVAIAGAGILLYASAHEGQGLNVAPWGFVCLGGGVLAFIGFAAWALVRALS